MLVLDMSGAGSGERHGRLWGARAEAWAEQEELEAPRFEHAIERTALAPGQAVLDVGCGSGVFLRKAVGRGGRGFGLDASAALVEIARRRVPEADLRVGDLQFLPYDDDSFDVVTGFNSFQFAADMTAALREAGRVAKPGAAVVIQVWGRPERSDLTPFLAALRRLRPAPARGAPLPPLEQLVVEADLEPQSAFDFSFACEYQDERTLVRRMLAPGAVAEAIRTSGEEAVRRAIVESLAPCRSPSGRYRLETEWHYLLARA